MTQNNLPAAHQPALLRQDNIVAIVSIAPQSYQDNLFSSQRCISAGQALLDDITAQGMTDTLDQQAALYIEKARKTVKKMNERRTPVTQLFDDIRRKFTALENDIDPTRDGSIPCQLQQLRNTFAQKKHREELLRLKEQQQQQARQQALNQLRQDIEDDLRSQFRSFLDIACSMLIDIDNAVSLDNYDNSFSQISACPAVLPDDFINELVPQCPVPAGITVQQADEIAQNVKQALTPDFRSQYASRIEELRQDILDRLPSKKASLERMAQADAEEAARIKTEMEARQRREAEEAEAQRRHKEEEEKQRLEMARQQSEMESLFASQAVKQEYSPKTKVTKKIEILNPEGIMPVISMWWSKEGCRLSVEELAKMFRKQITFCEKLANKEEIYIEDESVCYIDDVKAR